MPLHKGKDTKGSFWEFGKQKKYHFKQSNKKSELTAKKHAIAQGLAILFSQHKQKNIKKLL